MLTQDRAKEVVKKQSVFPYWGNYRKFMTQDEICYVEGLFKNWPHGNISFASLVNKIALGQSVEIPDARLRSV